MTTYRSIASVVAAGLALMTVAACSKKPADTSTAETTTAATPAAEPTAAATTAAVAPVAYASLTGNAGAGEKVFVQCKACHVVDPGVNRVGPSLHGVVGRKAGSIEGFRYSPANKNSGITWTEDELYTYLEHPQKTVPGTYMTFPGLKDAQQRADVIAYLKTNS